MAVQPSFHWHFKEQEGSNVTASIGGVAGKGHKIRQDAGVGRIGDAVRLSGMDSFITFGGGALSW